MLALDLHHRAPRILVVDDEEGNRTLLTRLLTRQGWVAETASGGKEALRAIAESPPDLVLLDVMMPDGPDGFEVTRATKSNDATRFVPVVLVTGLLDRHQRLAGIEAGADDFLTKPFDPQELVTRVRSLLRLKSYTDELESAESVILSLGLTVESRDPYTNGHCRRLERYSLAMGQSLGLNAEELAALRRGAFLHDVGKIGIPDAILHKPHRLTEVETAVMQEHPVIGERLCGGLRSLRDVRPIIRYHHERRDGSGYPEGLTGDEIPLLAEIVGIADTFDAITTSRPYRAALPIELAERALRDEVARGLWQPDLVERFFGLLGQGVFASEEAAVSEKP